MRRSRTLAFIGLVGLSLLAACGDDDGDSIPMTGNRPTTTVEETTTTTTGEDTGTTETVLVETTSTTVGGATTTTPAEPDTDEGAVP